MPSAAAGGGVLAGPDGAEHQDLRRHLVQAHVADEFKGRVFVIYDMIFNVVLVVAAVIAAVILPANGKSVIILIIMAVGYLLVALGFALASRGVSMDEGTELRAASRT